MVAYTPRLLGFGIAALAALAACEVRGVIGSNVGMDGDAGAEGLDGNEDGTQGNATAATDAMPDDGNVDIGSEGTTTGDNGNDDTVFDLGTPDAPAVCGAPVSVSCDDDADPAHAIGVNCGRGMQGEFSYSGDSRSMHVHEGMLGSSGTYAPREGSKLLILSSGEASQIAMTPAELSATGCDPVLCPSQQYTTEALQKLPDPIEVRRVADDGRDCADDPTLVGLGDCSNTLEDEWAAGSGAHDYSEVRISAVVPEGADAFKYEFAFFTIEYPLFAQHDSPFNDMYIAWLQSEAWTGNVSFDDDGNPITINGVFLQYRDADSEVCPGCTAPELAGFAAEGHAGTDWLTTVAPVKPGEQIELVIAVMDLTDGVFDTAVALDGFEWTCTDLPPITTPAR